MASRGGGGKGKAESCGGLLAVMTTNEWIFFYCALCSMSVYNVCLLASPLVRSSKSPGQAGVADFC